LRRPIGVFFGFERLEPKSTRKVGPASPTSPAPVAADDTPAGRVAESASDPLDHWPAARTTAAGVSHLKNPTHAAMT
jgi:hypothetical protein